MARSLRPQFEGAIYHLVVRANNRQPLFRDDHDRRWYLELLRRYKNRFELKIYAFLLVSRKVHLLVETPRGNVSKVMQCLGTSYTSYFNRRHKRRGTLFEGRYRSYLVDKKSSLPELTRYIHRDHVQPACGVNRKRNFAWSSYRIYLGRKVSDLVQTEVVLGHFGQRTRQRRKRYQEFVENNSFRRNAHRGEAYSQRIVTSSVLEQKAFSQSPISPTELQKIALGKAERILREVSLCMDANEVGNLREGRRRALARHLAMYLIRRQTSLPLRSIGELLGVKAPAVALGIDRVEKLLKRDDFYIQFKALLEVDPYLSSKDGTGEYAFVSGELKSGTGAA